MCSSCADGVDHPGGIFGGRGSSDALLVRVWPALGRGLIEANVRKRLLVDIRQRSLASGMTAPIDRSRTFIGPIIAGIILIVLFGGYVLFAWLAGDV